MHSVVLLCHRRNWDYWSNEKPNNNFNVQPILLSCSVWSKCNTNCNLCCYCSLSHVFLQVHGPITASLFTPDNIRYLASNLHPTAHLNSRVIHFSPGGENDLLLEIPLDPRGPKTAYVITVALNSSHPNTKEVDSDLIVGISDGMASPGAC